MDESKWPIGFVPEPDLQGLEPLPCGSDKPKDNSNLSKPKDNSNFSKPSQPSDRQTVGGNDANIFKPSQQRKVAQGDTRHSHGGSETSHGGPGGGIVQNPEQMLERSPRERSHHVEEPGYTRSSRSSSNKQSILGSGNGNVGWDLNPNPNANPNPNPRRSGGEKYNSYSKSPRERSHHVEEPGYTRTSRSYWNKQSSLGTGSGGGYSKPPSKGQRCRYYESGRCKKGASCKYLHTPK